jgi:hypothetical protein
VSPRLVRPLNVFSAKLTFPITWSTPPAPGSTKFKRIPFRPSTNEPSLILRISPYSPFLARWSLPDSVAVWVAMSMVTSPLPSAPAKTPVLEGPSTS